MLDIQPLRKCENLSFRNVFIPKQKEIHMDFWSSPLPFNLFFPVDEITWITFSLSPPPLIEVSVSLRSQTFSILVLWWYFKTVALFFFLTSKNHPLVVLPHPIVLLQGNSKTSPAELYGMKWDGMEYRNFLIQTVQRKFISFSFTCRKIGILWMEKKSSLIQQRWVLFSTLTS